VVADQTGRDAARGATRFRLRWLAVVVGIMAVLTAGWPLLNSTVANQQPLASGSRITVGSGRNSSGTVTVGAGWYVQPEQSNPAQQYVLRSGALVLDVRHISFVSSEQVAGILNGMRQVLAITNPGFRLGAAVTTTTVHGSPAVTITVSGQRMTGMATIVLGPSREFAIVMVAFAPTHTNPAIRAAARQVVASLIFGRPSR
jgi:hypothetical protein